jgi:hypothetical protein
VPGFRSYPVIWSTLGIVYAGQRLTAWSTTRKSLVTRPAASAALSCVNCRMRWSHGSISAGKR